MSIRTRLTLSFTGLFGIIVLVLATGSYMLVRNSLLSDLNTQLQVAVDGTAMAAQHELLEHPSATPGEKDLQEILDGMREASLPDTQILVRQGNRQVAYETGSSAPADLRTISSERLRQGSYDNLRIAFHELRINKFNLTYEIYAAASTDGIFNRLRRFALVLFILVPLGLLAAAAAGFGLARKALAPLNELSKTIDAVTSSDLSMRIKPTDEDGEISAIGKRFNGLLDRLQRAFDSERSFMADASHELRTPVTIALAAVQVTHRDPSRTRQDSDEALRIVEQQMLRLKNIVQQLLLLSQSDSSALSVNLKYVYLDDVVEAAIRAARVLTKEKLVSIELEPPPEAQIRGDSELLGQALMVLLDNAVKFTPSGGRIGVGIRRRGAYWVCHICDTGTGIPESAQPHIFERFYRAGKDTGGRPIGGSGLGLPIAKTIIDGHAGTLRLVESRPGFTRFEIEIPAAESEEYDSRTENQPSGLVVKI